MNKTKAQRKRLVEGPRNRRRGHKRAAHPQNLPGQIAAGERLQGELRGQEALLQVLTEDGQQVFWLASADQRRMFYVSPSCEHIFGRSCDDLLRNPMNWLGAIHPEDRPRVEAEMARDCGKRFAREYRIIRPDGAIRWILARGYTVRNERGNPCCSAGLAEDITARKHAEDALAAEQRLLNNLITATPDIIYFKDRVGRFIRVNEAFARRIASSDLSSLIGKTDFDIYGEQHSREARADEQRIMATGKPIIDKEEREDWKDGHVTWVSTTKMPLLDGAGRIIGIMGISRDITARKHAEAQAQQLAAIVESSEDAIISRGLDGTIRTWNRAAERIFGYRAKEVIGQNVALFIPENRKAHEAAIVEKMRKGKRIQNYETIRLKKDGTPLPISFTISPVCDASGKVVGASAIVRDLSERKRTEEALKESDTRYRSLFENMTSGFAYCRMLFKEGRPHDFIYLEVNKGFEKLTGLRNVVGQRACEVVPGRLEKDRELFERFGRVALTGQPERFEIYSAALRRWFYISAFCPEKEHFVSVFENITGRKETEKRMRMFSQEIVAAREEERRRVSSALHHDVGSMAVGISAYLDAIESDLRSGKPGEALQWMKRTRKLFDQSVVHLKRLAVEIRPPELDVLGLRAALRQHFSQVTERIGTRIRFRETQRRRQVSPTAATILFRVAQEALTNAIKHGYAEQVDVNLRTSNKEIKLTVRDNGKGFDLSELGTRSTPWLGLRVMREMAASAGGAFTVESRPGKGTTVRLSLPIETKDPGLTETTMREEAIE